MRVFVLTAERVDTEETGDYDGTTSVHATRESAIKALDAWLEGWLISPEDAHYGEVKSHNGSVCCDPDPDIVGHEIHWGINEMEVHE